MQELVKMSQNQLKQSDSNAQLLWQIFLHNLNS